MIKIIFALLLNFLTFHFPTDAAEEPKKISSIYPQDDWDRGLFGYVVKLDDGSLWFSERGPSDYWDWAVGDEVSVELLENPLDRRILQLGLMPLLIDTPFRIINFTRQDYDEFQFLIARPL